MGGNGKAVDTPSDMGLGGGSAPGAAADGNSATGNAGATAPASYPISSFINNGRGGNGGLIGVGPNPPPPTPGEDGRLYGAGGGGGSYDASTLIFRRGGDGSVQVWPSLHMMFPYNINSYWIKIF